MSSNVATPKPNHSDKRYFPRWEIQNRVSYRRLTNHKTHTGYTQDLSCTGACLLINEVICPQEELFLTVYLSRDKKVELQGRIIWTTPIDKKTKLGIHFFNTPPQVADIILEHAFRLNPTRYRQHLFEGWNGPI